MTKPLLDEEYKKTIRTSDSRKKLMAFKRACIHNETERLNFILSDVETMDKEFSILLEKELLICIDLTMLYEHVEIIKALYETPFFDNLCLNRTYDTTKHSYFINKSCEKSNIDIIQFLLKNEKFKDYINIDTISAECLCNAVYRGNTEIINYLILDYGIKKTPEIEKKMKDEYMFSQSKIEELFNIKELYEKVKTNVKEKEKTVSKNKI